MAGGVVGANPVAETVSDALPRRREEERIRRGSNGGGGASGERKAGEEEEAGTSSSRFVRGTRMSAEVEHSARFLTSGYRGGAPLPGLLVEHQTPTHVPGSATAVPAPPPSREGYGNSDNNEEEDDSEECGEIDWEAERRRQKRRAAART